MNEKLKNYLSDLHYSENVTAILDVSNQKVLDIRGWGRIIYMFEEYEEGEAFQNEVGKFVLDAINEKLNNELSKINTDVLAEDQISKETNSPIGSVHWYRTILGSTKRIGEFLKYKTPPEKELRSWGETLEILSKEMLSNYDKINQKK